MNVCRACRQDVGSVELFDRHRIGRHAYTFAEGLHLDRDYGRRCLDVDEMEAAGWRLNARGGWIDPSRDMRGRLREWRKRGEAVSP